MIFPIECLELPHRHRSYPEQIYIRQMQSPNSVRFPSSPGVTLPLPFVLPKFKHLFEMLTDVGCSWVLKNVIQIKLWFSSLANTHCSFVVKEPQTYAYSQFTHIHLQFTSYIILLILLIHSFSKYPRISQAFKTVCLKDTPIIFLFDGYLSLKFQGLSSFESTCGSPAKSEKWRME